MVGEEPLIHLVQKRQGIAQSSGAGIGGRQTGAGAHAQVFLVNRSSIDRGQQLFVDLDRLGKPAGVQVFNGQGLVRDDRLRVRRSSHLQQPLRDFCAIA